MKTLCVTGHRPNGLPWYKEGYDPDCHNEFIALLTEYIKFAIQNGFSHFIAGGALGIDTDFALSVLALKKQGEKITLEIAVPCLGQERYFCNEDKAVYNFILQKADKVTILSDKYYRFCMQKRNEYMIKKSDALLACWNGVKRGGTYSTIKLAQKTGKEFLLIEVGDGALNGGNKIIYFRNKLI